MTLDCFEHKMGHYCIKMEFQIIVNFLDKTSDDKDLPRLVSKKLIKVYDQSDGNYNINVTKLRSDLCDFNDAYIVLKRNIIVDKKKFTANDFEAPNNIAANATATNTANDNVLSRKKLVFKNNGAFINCISKINGVKLENAEDLHVVMSMYHLLEYSKNYRKTTGSFWNYYRDEPNSDTDANEIKQSIINSNYFDYKANFIDSVTHNNLTKNDVKIVVPLKYLSNFWRSLNIPLINCEVELILTWFKNCVFIRKSTDYDEPIDRKADTPENAIFQIADTKL